MKNILQASTFPLSGLLILCLLFPSTTYAKKIARRNPVIFFPQSLPPMSVENESYMMARNIGKLILKDGCLRLGQGETESRLLIWPGWFSFDVEDGVIYVMYTRFGTTVARMRIGDTITVGGGEVDDRPNDLQQPIPKECLGPYWITGTIEVKKAKKPKNSFRHSQRRFSPR